jgi:hypothetical protein
MSVREERLTVFIHIPRTAGTTFTRLLKSAHPSDSVGFVGNVFKGGGGSDPRRVAWLRESAAEHTRGFAVLAGHLPFGVHAYLPRDARYITFLRDPVDRVLSHYHWMMRLHWLDPGVDGRSLGELLAEGVYLHDNLQTRMLSSDPEPFGDVTPEMLEQAKANLAEAFTAFGLVERLDESLALLQRRLGLPLLRDAPRLKPTRRPRGAEIPDKMVRTARRYNKFDLQLYGWACELFDLALAAGDGVEPDLPAQLERFNGRLVDR